MTWFAAHLVMQVEFKSGHQGRYPVWENIHLIEAPDEEALLEKCKEIGRSGEGDSDGSFQWDNQPARWVFKGVRKVVVISNANHVENLPHSGCEITYSTFVFSDTKQFENFLRSETATAIILD